MSHFSTPSLASTILPDVVPIIIAGYIVSAFVVVAISACIGVRLLVQPIHSRQWSGILIASVTGTVIAAIAGFTSVSLAPKLGLNWFYVMAAFGVILSSVVSYCIARPFSQPVRRKTAARQPSESSVSGSSGSQSNPYAAPIANGETSTSSASPFSRAAGGPIEPTRIHRLFRSDLGELSKWVVNPSPGSVSFASFAPILVVAVGIGLATVSLFWFGRLSYLIVVLAIWCSIAVGRECAKANRLERRCRARLRRKECFHCGVSLEAERIDFRYCAGCVPKTSV